MTTKEYSIEVGGTTLTAEFNDLAEQANGAVMVRYGDTVILATAVMGGKRDGDFFPLTVDYEERFYAAGKISVCIRRSPRLSSRALHRQESRDRNAYACG